MVGLGDRYGEDTLKPVEAPAKLKRRNAMLESSLLERLIRVIEKHAKEMAEDLRQRLARDHRTSSFQVLDDRVLYENIFELYSHLGNWLLRDTEKGEVPSYYAGRGERSFEEGFALHEIVLALITTRRHIRDTIAEKGITATAKELDTVIDLITVLHRFFDMAIYYTIVGYYRPLGMEIERIKMKK